MAPRLPHPARQRPGQGARSACGGPLGRCRNGAVSGPFLCPATGSWSRLRPSAARRARPPCSPQRALLSRWLREEGWHSSCERGCTRDNCGGRPTFSRATENVPAFCECFACTNTSQRSAGPLATGVSLNTDCNCTGPMCSVVKVTSGPGRRPLVPPHPAAPSPASRPTCSRCPAWPAR